MTNPEQPGGKLLRLPADPDAVDLGGTPAPDPHEAPTTPLPAEAVRAEYEEAVAECDGEGSDHD